MFVYTFLYAYIFVQRSIYQKTRKCQSKITRPKAPMNIIPQKFQSNCKYVDHPVNMC